jgi:hypothetical protein
VNASMVLVTAIVIEFVATPVAESDDIPSVP